MVDPVSIAGLTIAILDDLIELSIWTSNVIQDARAFDSVYGGSTLFDQFELDVQQQTIQLLEESKDTLRAGHSLLQRRYGSVSTVKNGPIPPTTPPAFTRSGSNPALSTVLLWSVRDKKRVEILIRKFNDQIQRVQDNVKLWCLANQLGVDPGHLQRLQNDEGSRKLGFDLDATLRLTQRDAAGQTTSLELPENQWASSLDSSTKVVRAPAFCTFTKDGKLFLQENHVYDPPDWWLARCDNRTAVTVDPATKNRIEALARLLHQPKEQVFRIPPCLGWSYLQQKRCVSFVFSASCSPISLLELLTPKPKAEGPNPELGDKFRLAAGLATCVAQLHMVGWLHESLRSENILFFPVCGTSATVKDIDLAAPSVLGFAFSRLDVGKSTFLVDFDPSRDIYRHPQRQGAPEVSFTRKHDIYALGIVLLEIGLWKPAVSLQKDNFRDAKLNDRYEVSKQLLHHAEHRLERRVGRKYKEVVIRCLKGEFGVVDDNREDLKLQQAFRSQVVDVLERAADAV
ncbi:hypothetical protein LTR70_003180 [Exophiala xenobiotica]|uniref:Protein kinase domain-containing protein n=1 Tax=Lithohypha guttulata TaxID=1690604 RepID=A0ABR0KGK9_9EURO|nr:hypothetical protein LTR24_002825 [Lithohypha guttulata]KAK5323692.1 hypothetical protein LTR70_003180 [Exophiala xenobiotica]